MNKLEKAHVGIVAKAATIAVNFSKDRFRQQNWVGNTTQPWKRRKTVTGKGSKRKNSRAILVQTGALKRDVHKIYVGNTSAIIGTSNLTGAYAKAHNEGFKGTVTVKAHTRKRYHTVTETYKTKKGNDRTRSRRAINSSLAAIKVKAHSLKMNLPKRQFIGNSPVLDNQIQRMMTAEYLKALR